MCSVHRISLSLSLSCISKSMVFTLTFSTDDDDDIVKGKDTQTHKRIAKVKQEWIQRIKSRHTERTNERELPPKKRSGTNFLFFLHCLSLFGLRSSFSHPFYSWRDVARTEGEGRDEGLFPSCACVHHLSSLPYPFGSSSSSVSLCFHGCLSLCTLERQAREEEDAGDTPRQAHTHTHMQYLVYSRKQPCIKGRRGNRIHGVCSSSSSFSSSVSGSFRLLVSLSPFAFCITLSLSIHRREDQGYTCELGDTYSFSSHGFVDFASFFLHFLSAS